MKKNHIDRVAKDIFVPVAVALALLSGAYYVFFRDTRTAIDCLQLSKQIHKQAEQKKYKEAYVNKSKNDLCLGLVAKSDTYKVKVPFNGKDKKMIFYHDVAVAAYLSAHKQEAKKYANAAFEFNKTMNASERSKVPYQLGKMIDIINIQSGTFTSAYGGANL